MAAYPKPVGRVDAPRETIRTGSIVVYTAITRGYDRLKEQPRSATDGVDFIAFLDRPAKSMTWQWRAIHAEFGDPARNAKIHKILPHRYFPDALYSMWIDGAVAIRFAHSIEEMIRLYLADCDLTVFPHKGRTCLYQEASVCMQRQLDDPQVIWQQISRYTREGYPPDAGLAECPVVLRRHTPAVNAFNEAWWDEITSGSKRDQISFPYAARRVGLRYGTLPGVIAQSPLFTQQHHALPSRPVRAFNRARRYSSSLSAAARATVTSLRVALYRRSPSVPSWLGEPALVGSANAYATTSAHAEPSVRPSADPGPVSLPQPRATTVPSSTARVRRSRRVAFGPVRDVPSWSWIGFDTARELSKDFQVSIYDSWAVPPDCDVLFIVKDRPPEHFVSAAQRQGTTLVYCPLDVYRDPAHITRDAGFLQACAMVLVHSERLLPFIHVHCRAVHFIDHHTRYGLSPMADYKEAGFILWIGGFQYVPYLVQWLERYPIAHEIRLLTDVRNHRARDAARMFAAEIGVKLEISERTTSVAGCRLYPWSERLQSDMMRECKAAFDVKVTEKFEQYLKPPTKAQQYIASGIPFAVNPDSYSAEYFRVRGFDVASPSDTARWLSREYWEATQAPGKQLRAATSIEVVAARYRDLIESL